MLPNGSSPILKTRSRKTLTQESGRIRPEMIKKLETNMRWIKKIFKSWPLIFIVLTGLVLAGCEGSDSREKVDDTVR